MMKILEILNNLVNVLIRYIGYLFLIINGKQVNACAICLNDNIQRNNPESTSFASSFALDTKTDFSFTTTQRDTNFRIFHQFKLKCINVFSKRVIALSQALGLTKEFFCIVESNHNLLCFSSKFLNQSIKRFQIFPCKTPFLGFIEAFGNSLCNKGFLSLIIFRGRSHLINGHTFYSPKNLFQTWDKACILNIQYYLCHNTKRFAILLQS